MATVYTVGSQILACRCIQSFVEKVLKWFNLDNGTVFSLNSRKFVFGLLNECGPSVAKLYFALFAILYLSKETPGRLIGAPTFC